MKTTDGLFYQNYKYYYLFPFNCIRVVDYLRKFKHHLMMLFTKKIQIQNCGCDSFEYLLRKSYEDFRKKLNLESLILIEKCKS